MSCSLNSSLGGLCRGYRGMTRDITGDTGVALKQSYDESVESASSKVGIASQKQVATVD